MRGGRGEGWTRWTRGRSAAAQRAGTRGGARAPGPRGESCALAFAPRGGGERGAGGTRQRRAAQRRRTHLGHLNVDLVQRLLVELHQVLQLLADLALGPLLPLGLAAAHGGLHLGLLRLDLSLRHPARSSQKGKRVAGRGRCLRKQVVSGGGQRAPRGGEKTQPRGGRGYEMAARAKRWGGEHAPGEPRSGRGTCGGFCHPGGRPVTVAGGKAGAK